MQPYVVLADATCDLPKELRDKFGIKDYMEGYMTVNGGKEILCDMDWESISRDDFYTLLNDRHNHITTSPPSIERYAEIYEKYLAQGIGVLVIALSSAISGTYERGRKAAALAMEKYPGVPVINVDSFRMSGAYGLLVLYAQKYMQEGMSIEENAARLEQLKLCIHQMGPIDDLIIVARRGRITMGKAVMGSLAGIKPMGDCNSTGYATMLTKVKGIARALKGTVEYIRLMADDIQNNYVFITHTDRAEYANDLAERIRKELQPKDVFVVEALTQSAANIGSGMVAAYFIGQPVTETLDTERETLIKALSI